MLFLFCVLHDFPAEIAALAKEKAAALKNQRCRSSLRGVGHAVRESGVTGRTAKVLQDFLCNIVTIFLATGIDGKSIAIVVRSFWLFLQSACKIRAESLFHPGGGRSLLPPPMDAISLNKMLWCSGLDAAVEDPGLAWLDTETYAGPFAHGADGCGNRGDYLLRDTSWYGCGRGRGLYSLWFRFLFFFIAK